MDKFSDFISEQKNEQPYRFVNLIHHTPDDPNKTGDLMVAEAKKLGINDTYQLNVDGGYLTLNGKGNLVAHNFSVEEGKVVSAATTKNSDKKIIHDKEGFEISSENTICFVRVAIGRGYHLLEQLRLHGVKTVNSRYCHMICDDKWFNYVALERSGFRQPKTDLISHIENLDTPIKNIGGKYPMILKSASGTQGVGVIFIDSKQALLSTMQLINKIDENVRMVIQEYIKTPYDVRAMVLNGEVVGQLKRPIITGDFRSNISQGNEPEKIELTELEKSECIKVAKEVDGMWVGVDFIPSKDREKESPYFIEVNSSPGTTHISELNNVNIHKKVIETFKNRENWRKL